MARIRKFYQKAILLARLQRQSLGSPLLMSASKCTLKWEFSRMPARESSFRRVKWNPLQAVESHCCALIINPIVTIYPPIDITGGGCCYSLGFFKGTRKGIRKTVRYAYRPQVLKFCLTCFSWYASAFFPICSIGRLDTPLHAFPAYGELLRYIVIYPNTAIVRKGFCQTLFAPF